MRINFLLLITIMLITACSDSDTAGKFDPNETLTITGKFEEINGDPLVNKSIYLKNLRRFGFIDFTAAAVATIIDLYRATIWIAAWPFYWFFDVDPDLPEVDPTRDPGYFFDNVQTSTDGSFSFKVRAGDLLEDASGNINIDLVNDASADNPAFGRFAFVIDDVDTDLGTVQLCDLDGVDVVDSGSDIVISWQAPEDPVDRYFVNIGMAEDNTLIWSSEVDGESNSLTLSKTVFSNWDTRIAVEAFYTFSDDRKVSCLSPRVEFSATNPVTSKASDALATVEGIDFVVTSLTNGTVADNIYFSAFDSREVVLDLGATTSFERLVFHNLKLDSAGTATIELATTAGDYQNSSSFEELRFVNHVFDSTQTARFIRLTFSSDLVDLQEITVY